MLGGLPKIIHEAALLVHCQIQPLLGLLALSQELLLSVLQRCAHHVVRDSGDRLPALGPATPWPLIRLSLKGAPVAMPSRRCQ